MLGGSYFAVGPARWRNQFRSRYHCGNLGRWGAEAKALAFICISSCLSFSFSSLSWLREPISSCKSHTRSAVTRDSSLCLSVSASRDWYPWLVRFSAFNAASSAFELIEFLFRNSIHDDGLDGSGEEGAEVMPSDRFEQVPALTPALMRSHCRCFLRTADDQPNQQPEGAY